MMTKETMMQPAHTATDLRQTLRMQLMAFGIGFAAAGAMLVLFTA